MNRTFHALAAAALLACGSANAVHVTALPGSTTYGFGAENYFGAGPKVVAPGITWSSQASSSVYGYVGGYGFQSNGGWNGLSMIGSNHGSDTMTLAFSSAVSGVGAFMNWARFDTGTPDGIAPVIAVYDSSNTLLESYSLTFGPLGGTNSGEFHGFSRGSADISYMTFTGAYIGAANLEVLSNPVPEPATYALMGLGLLAIGAIARRRKA